MEEQRLAEKERRRQEKLKIEECKREREARHKEFIEARSVKAAQEEEERRIRLKRWEKEKAEEDARKFAERERVSMRYAMPCCGVAARCCVLCMYIVAYVLDSLT
jgi:hypothetical protein